ncbi:hypothetical protein [Marinobacter sp.]|uniref:hypothetical protein n=1 Tax=Marinobacter sp. TaxID=50741 RepID=UPI00385173AD
MKHRHILPVPLLTALLLAGCGPDDSDSANNPASSVNLVFSTFTIDRQEDLEESLFRDFYRGIEPASADNTDARAWAHALRDHIGIFIGSTPVEDGRAYKSVRNPFDLMAQVIASNQVDNFRDGRRFISDRIDKEVAGTFNTRSNDASIRFVDQEAVNDEKSAVADREWRYETLAWTYAPAQDDGVSGTVSRIIQYTARPPAGADTAEPPELQSLLVGSQFSEEFKAIGYNQPEIVEASFTALTIGRMSLSQDFISEKRDNLFISETNAIEVGGQMPDCVRVELDYQMARVTVFTSESEDPLIDDEATADPDDKMKNMAYCGNQESGSEEISYAAEAVPDRK